MRKNIIILGTSRSGKTKLAVKISRELNYNIIGTDSLVSAFENTYPNMGISHKIRDGSSTRNLEPFLTNYIKSLNSSFNRKIGLNFIIEGAYINWEKIHDSYISKNFVLILLGTNYDSAEEYYTNIRKYDTENEWTYYLSDEELLSYCKNLKNENDRLKNIIKNEDIMYYNTAFDREKVFERIILDLKPKIEQF